MYRRSYALLAFTTILFTFYVSLLPFRLRFEPWPDVWAEFASAMSASSERISRTNFLANVLLFVPVGLGLMGAQLAERPRRLARSVRAAAMTLLLSVAASLTAEFLQVFAPRRVVSPADVVAQTSGCGVGIVAWVMAGDSLTTWMRGLASRHRDDRVARLLTAYAAAWIIVNLAPFDIIVDLDLLAQRVRGGMIALVPFGSGAGLPEMTWDALIATLSAVPLGALGLVGGVGLSQRRGAVPAFLIGAMLVGGTEVAQIFIRSHAADATDGLFGCLGVAIGIAAARRLFLHRHLEGRSADALATKAIAALLAWCLVLMAYHWQPFDFRVDADAVRSKAAAFSLIPFAGYQSGSDLNALNTLLTKTGLAVPAGFVSAFALRRALPASLLTPVVAVGAALVFGTLEAGQFFLPARYPDATDVLIGVAGAWLGLRVARWLSAASSQEP